MIDHARENKMTDQVAAPRFTVLCKDISVNLPEISVQRKEKRQHNLE